MSCDAERVTAYVDEALAPAERAEVEAHLAGCRECRDQADEERELRGRLRALAAPPPPPQVEARVRRSLRPRPGAARWLLPLAAGLVVLVAWGRGASPFVAWELSRDHDHCFGQRRLPARVWSSDPSRISAWLEGQGTTVPVIPDGAAGLELVGARYCTLLDRTVAHLYYTGGDKHLSLFVVPGPVRSTSREMRPRGNFVRLMRVGGTEVGLVSEEEESVDAFERALSTTVAREAGTAFAAAR